MAVLDNYKNLEEIISAILHKQVDIENLLDWESGRKLSKWLEKIGEADKAYRLAEEYDTTIDNPSLLLEVLTFSKEEIEDILSGKAFDDGKQHTKTLSAEELTREVALLKEQIRGLSDLRMPVGTISLFPTESIPRGWLRCEGQCLSISYFESLFVRLKHTWGSNGNDNFFLPNLRLQACHTGLCYCIFTGEYRDLPKGAIKPLLQFTVNGVSFEMVFVEGGTFMMGNAEGCDNEKIVHQVTLSSFYMGQFQVTQALWKTVMSGDNPSSIKGDMLPVENVGHDIICNNFIKKLNELTGGYFRLPTEAEWEFAARGGKQSRGFKYSGSNKLEEVAWFKENSSYHTHPVGQKKPNELGIYDMSGNVREWCKDWYSDSYNSSNEMNPIGPSIGPGRVFRGGGKSDDASGCSVSCRNYHPPFNTFNYWGLRLAFIP